MSARLEKKWRALPPERELKIRLEILVEETRGLDESKATCDTATPGTKTYRVAEQSLHHFMTRCGRTEKRIAELLVAIKAKPPRSSNDEAARSLTEEQTRARQLRRLRANAQTMVERFLVVTPGFNSDFLDKLGVTSLDVNVDAVLKAHGIRLVSLDNPARYGPDRNQIRPLKFLALHPDDVTAAVKILRPMVAAKGPAKVSKRKPLDPKAVFGKKMVVWLPRKANGWQHPNRTLTTYPDRITRLALEHSTPKRRTRIPPGHAILRGWGANLRTERINNTTVPFSYVADKRRYEANLGPVQLAGLIRETK